MKFSNLQNIVSKERLSRYLDACGGNQDLAIALYRTNIRISVEMFTIVGAFEIALRNAIDKVMTRNHGANWLEVAILPGGFFDVPQCREHAQIIRFAYAKLCKSHNYTHSHLLAKLEFGVWKYMFSGPQFKASGRILLKAFPNKPVSNRNSQYNNTTIFNELDHVNSLRNRIAHHEPICFPTGKAEITTDYIRWITAKMLMLFEWLGIDAQEYLKGISNFESTLANIDEIRFIVNTNSK